MESQIRHSASDQCAVTNHRYCYANTLLFFCLEYTNLRLDLCSGPLQYLDSSLFWLSWVDLNFLPGRPGESFVALQCVRVTVVNKNTV